MITIWCSLRDVLTRAYRVSPCDPPLSRHDCAMSAAFDVFLLRHVVDPTRSPPAVQLQHPDAQRLESAREPRRDGAGAAGTGVACVAESHPAIMLSCFDGESRPAPIRTAIAPALQDVV